MKKRNISQIALYRKDGKFLFQHRSSDDKAFPNFWGFFGGPVDEGESFIDAVIRETKEELEYELKDPEFFHEFTLEKESETVHKKSFMEEYDGLQKLVLHEGQGMKWLTPMEAKKLKINAWNLDTLDQLQKKLNAIQNDKNI